MKTHTRLATLTALLGILGFMLGAVSCTAPLPPPLQAQLDDASKQYTTATGLTPVQTGTFLTQWWLDLQAARAANKAAADAASAPNLGPIQATQAAPVTNPTPALQAPPPQASTFPLIDFRQLPDLTVPAPPPNKGNWRPDARDPAQLASN